MLTRPHVRQGHLAIVLVALATLTVQLATVTDATPRAWPLLEAVVLFAIALALRNTSSLGPRIRSQNTRVVILVSFIAWPLVSQFVGRAFGIGLPLESLWLRSLQGMALGIVGESNISVRRDVLAIGASAFAVVFSASMAPTSLTRSLALAFAALSTAWLIVQASPASDAKSLIAAKHTGWGQGFAIATVVVCLAATALIARPQVMAARSGWLASSGGTGSFDPFARSGVGDGDALVRAEKDASSVGPISETNVFLATDTPSLYDMFNDMYGTPPKPKKVERAVPLPSDLTPRDEQQIATSKQAGREFSAVRQPPQRRDIRDRDSRAVLQIAGRTPVHLRLAAFDVFDGREWFPADKPAAPHSLVMQNRDGVPWLWLRKHLRERENSIGERHSVKILSLDTAQIPLLAETTHLRIDQVADVDFFSWQQEGVVAMEGRESIPPLTVIELISDLTVSESPFRVAASVATGAAPTRELSLPQSEYASRIATLAKEWTSGCDTSDKVLAAVVKRLRDDYAVDRFVPIEESATDVVGEFLFQRKRGPDYLFASSAVMLLRTLGYPSRLVSGLYASPARYERRSGLTPVMPEDVHFWVEVRGERGQWISLEPTPGYELLPPRKTWRQALIAAANGVAKVVHEFRLAIAAAVFVICVIYVQRFRLTDLLTEGFWRLCVAIWPEQVIAWTLFVLNWRSIIAGRGRVRGVTHHQWFNQLSSRCPCAADAQQAFLQDLAAALYGPPANTKAASVPSELQFDHRKVAYLEVIRAYRGQRMRCVRTSVAGDGKRPDAPAWSSRATTRVQEATGRC